MRPRKQAAKARLKRIREKAELRRLLARQRAVINWSLGEGPFASPLSPSESQDFTRLGRKYKYDPAFIDTLLMYEFKGAKTRSKAPTFKPWIGDR
jgi:hypothetical protein